VRRVLLSLAAVAAAGAPVHEHAAGVEGAVRGVGGREVPHPPAAAAAAAARQRGAVLQQPRRRRAHRAAALQRPPQAIGARPRVRSTPARLARQRALPPGRNARPIHTARHDSTRRDGLVESRRRGGANLLFRSALSASFLALMLRCHCPSVCLSVCDGSALAHYS